MVDRPGLTFVLISAQLTKIRRDSECHFNDNTLVQIVRLTVETNLLTSKSTLDVCGATLLTHISATVGIVALLVVVIFPVSDSQIVIGSEGDIILI